MRILGIDYGEKRIGLAISDETQTFSREIGILSPKEFWKQVYRILQENEVTKIVLGWPLNMSGEETKKTKEVESFKLKVESKTGLPVEIMDERLTSVMAVHLRQGFGGLPSKNNKKVGKTLPAKNEYVDSLAAQILLQNYLDKSKKN